MKEGTPNKILNNLNKQTKGVTDLFNGALNTLDKQLKGSLTNKQFELFKAFNAKYLDLVLKGELDKAEELKTKFKNEQF
tara:strand:+ start:452 stop:688 length:237 start_codon:yes stop_codon:yes gene_type:complete